MARTKNKETKTEDASESHALHLERLQKRLQFIVRDIESKSRGFVGRATRARSVDPKVIEAGFAEIEASVGRAREAYAASLKADDVGAVARVDLRTL